MMAHRPNRRRVLGWVSLAVGGLTSRRLGAQEAPVDRGIGGTGAAPPEDRGDQGIGGTGVVGTIRRFGSIVVNDIRIGYAPDVVVTIDGRAARVGDLRLGQVVRTVALTDGERFVTRAIAVTSEVIGPLERRVAHRLTILGQVIDIRALPRRPHWRLGERLRVSGLRRPDGVVVASLVEPTQERQDRIAGTVEQSGGRLRVGGIALRNVPAALTGQRIVLKGHVIGGVFVASAVEPEVDLLQALMSPRLSLEVLLQRRGDRLRCGSGLEVDDAAFVAVVADHTLVRAVVSASVSAGRIVVDRVSVLDRVGHAEGAARNGASTPAATPAGPRPGGPGPAGSPPGGPGPAGPAHGPGGAGPGGGPSR